MAVASGRENGREGQAEDHGQAPVMYHSTLAYRRYDVKRKSLARAKRGQKNRFIGAFGSYRGSRSAHHVRKSEISKARSSHVALTDLTLRASHLMPRSLLRLRLPHRNRYSLTAPLGAQRNTRHAEPQLGLFPRLLFRRPQHPYSPSPTPCGQSDRLLARHRLKAAHRELLRRGDEEGRVDNRRNTP